MIKTRKTSDTVRFGYRNPDGSKTVYGISGSKTYTVSPNDGEVEEAFMSEEVENFALANFGARLTRPSVQPRLASRSRTK